MAPGGRDEVAEDPLRHLPVERALLVPGLCPGPRRTPHGGTLRRLVKELLQSRRQEDVAGRSGQAGVAVADDLGQATPRKKPSPRLFRVCKVTQILQIGTRHGDVAVRRDVPHAALAHPACDDGLDAMDDLPRISGRAREIQWNPDGWHVHEGLLFHL